MERMDVSQLPQLEEDDDRSKWMAIAATLRAAIRAGHLAPGTWLPTGAELGRHFGVSKATVVKALDQLRNDGDIDTRQGAGAFVRLVEAVPVDLRLHFEQVLEATDELVIAFAGLTSETLRNALVEPLDRIRTGRYSVERIELRILLPDTSRPWSAPCLADGSDSPMMRDRMRSISEASTNALVDVVEELGDLGYIREVVTEVRHFGTPPPLKICLVNGDLFAGMYELVPRSIKTDTGEKVDVVDMMGKATAMVHHLADGDPTAKAMIRQSGSWFESVWSLAAAHSSQEN